MNVKIYVRAWLCLYLSLSVFHLEAQDLKVGDTLPREVWNLPLQVLNHPDGKETVTLNDYKGKLIILDFWATWCSPCVAMLPKQDSLQKEFEGRLQILPVTYQTGEEVSAFMEKYNRLKQVKSLLPKVVNDNALQRVFTHNSLPHYVWIDSEGKIKAITGYKEVTRETVAGFVSDQLQNMPVKTDEKLIPYDPSRPLFINGNGGEVSTLMYHSLLSGYQEGLPSGYSIDMTRGRKITSTNQSLVQHYRLAYGEGRMYIAINRTLLADEIREELTSPTTSEAYRVWKRQGNVYCFELQVPPALSDSAYKIMQRILRENFPRYQAKMEKQTRRCLVLKRTSSNDKIASRGEPKKVEIGRYSCRITNSGLYELTYRLAAMFMPYSPFPIVDDTGYKANVDLVLNADLMDVDSVNKALEPYDLRLVESDYELEMLVITKSDKL